MLDPDGAVFDPHNPGPDYQLTWPLEVFRAEAAALLQRDGQLSVADAQLLLEEAFAGEAPRHDLTTVRWPGMPVVTNPWGGPGGIHSHAAAFLAYLAGPEVVLPQWSAPRPYWTTRQGRQVRQVGPGTLLDDGDRALRVQEDWARLVTDLQDRGYLDKVAPRDCVDDPEQPQWKPLSAEIENRIGIAGLWPIRPLVEEDLFYDLVEVVHDLVARPRSRRYHDYQQCGYHYSGFALAPGRALYRWRVNQLLTRHRIPLQLAEHGEDTGRLVHVASDDRDDLVRRALASPDPTDRDAVAHAVALFRGRAATREDKRSAVVALARVLEDRRRLLQAKLLSKDEGALFQIANQFDVRHRRADQHPDYDDAYLDWVYWWYLATVELTDRLRSRQP